MSEQHAPGPVGFECGDTHRATIGRATTENSAILRGIERRKVEREAMRAALAKADEFAMLVEAFFMQPADPKTGDGPAAPFASTVLRAARELRGTIDAARAAIQPKGEVL